MRVRAGPFSSRENRPPFTSQGDPGHKSLRALKICFARKDLDVSLRRRQWKQQAPPPGPAYLDRKCRASDEETRERATLTWTTSRRRFCLPPRRVSPLTKREWVRWSGTEHVNRTRCHEIAMGYSDNVSSTGTSIEENACLARSHLAMGSSSFPCGFNLLSLFSFFFRLFLRFFLLFFHGRGVWESVADAREEFRFRSEVRDRLGILIDSNRFFIFPSFSCLFLLLGFNV